MVRKIGTDAGETLTGSDQADQLYGRDGDDTLFGRKGRDSLFGDLGDDTVYGGVGADLLEGGAGDDYIRDEYGANRFKGGEGNDVLDFRGDPGSVVQGGPGADLFASVGYSDATLTGGPGADRFQVNTAFFGRAPDEPADRVTDFRAAQGDVIDLSSWADHIDSFVGDEPFSGAGQLRYEVDGDTTVVQADFEGDGVLNIEFLLSGRIALTDADFVF